MTTRPRALAEPRTLLGLPRRDLVLIVIVATLLLAAIIAVAVHATQPAHAETNPTRDAALTSVEAPLSNPLSQSPNSQGDAL